MGVLLSKEARKKFSGSAKISGSALSVDRGGRSENRYKKKNERSKSKLGRGISKSRAMGCGRVGEIWHIQKDCKQVKVGKGKDKDKDFVYIMESDGFSVLILSLAKSSVMGY